MIEDTTILNEYEERAQSFLIDTDTIFTIEFVDESCPPWEDDTKHIHGNKYRFTLTRGSRSYSADFWNSYADAMKDEIKHEERADYTMMKSKVKRLIKKAHTVLPSAYDVLACLDGFPRLILSIDIFFPCVG